MIESNILLLNTIVFGIIKKEKEIFVTDLIDKINDNQDNIQISLNLLHKDYEVISISGYKLFLTEKGNKYKSFNHFFSASSKEYIPIYQKLYLSLFIFFGICTLIFAYLNYSSKNKNELLLLKIDSLNKKTIIYKDSISFLKKEIKFNKTRLKIDAILKIKK